MCCNSFWKAYVDRMSSRWLFLGNTFFSRRL